MSKLLIIVINLIAFALCAYDKFAAKLGIRRIPEKVLLGIAAAFGSAGMLGGMFLFRHKTKHKNFVILVPVFLVIHVILLAVCGVAGFAIPVLWLV